MTDKRIPLNEGTERGLVKGGVIRETSKRPPPPPPPPPPPKKK
jgi:hypothetical protein